MTFWECYLQGWKKYAVFSGRARRKELWAWAVINTCVFCISNFLVAALAGESVVDVTADGFPNLSTATGICYWIICAVLFLPGLSMTARRFHDVGKSGWFCVSNVLYFFWTWIPIVGVVFLIVGISLNLIALFADEEPGENRYGPDPRENKEHASGTGGKALDVRHGSGSVWRRMFRPVGAIGNAIADTLHRVLSRSVVCEKCHVPMPVAAMFCSGCGARNPLICPQCGKRLPAVDAKFCPSCGTQNMRQMEREVKREEEKARAEREEAEAMTAMASKLASQMVDIPGKNFKLCKYEVTQELWEAVLGTFLSDFKGKERPVESVSWEDCQAFVAKLNAMPAVEASGLVYRLPTEEEWEYACRAGSEGDYCKLAKGTEISETTLGQVAWYWANSERKTHVVGQKEPNAFGLYDMHGNVWEWTATAIHGNRVYCGGSWGNFVRDCSAGSRRGDLPGYRSNNLGFRLAADVR